MNRRAIVIVAALLALLAAFAARRTLSKRTSFVPEPNAAEQTADTPDLKSASATPQTGAASTHALDGALSPMDSQLRPLGEAIEKSYASTIAAFALHGEEAEYEKNDSQAQHDAERLQHVFTSMRSELAPELAGACEAIIDRIAAAQLQLMAFAINRKNRGLPDSAQAEAELADRKAFKADAAPLFERIQGALNSAL